MNRVYREKRQVHFYRFPEKMKKSVQLKVEFYSKSFEIALY